MVKIMGTEQKLPARLAALLQGEGKQRLVVRLKFHAASGLQDLPVAGQELPGGQPALRVAVLGPWVGKIQVNQVYLSAGEKQRIGLARAFLKGSELILLDEPTSNVDSINEGMILKSLAEQKSKKSIILVSHRESTMAIADRIYKVENGVMTEEAQ